MRARSAQPCATNQSIARPMYATSSASPGPGTRPLTVGTPGMFHTNPLSWTIPPSGAATMKPWASAAAASRESRSIAAPVDPLPWNRTTSGAGCAGSKPAGR